MKKVRFVSSVIFTLLSFFVFNQVSFAASKQVNANEMASLCYSNEFNKQALLALAEDEFMIEADAERNKLALQLLNCLAVPEGSIRDGVAYFALSKWLRANQISVNTYQTMFEILLSDFGQSTIDDNQVYQPFVALTLAELARVDRKTPYLSKEQRQLLVEKSAQYMINVKDYRGFDDVVGWRHNVAHTADMFLQLALNTQLSKPQLSQMLVAIGQQTLAKNQHSYVFGESKRLVMPVLYIFLQNQHTEKDWKNWLSNHITNAPNTDWQQSYSSKQGLANLHNARAFLNAMYVLIADSKNAQLQMLKPALVATLKSIP